MANSAISALPVATNGLVLLDSQTAAADGSIDFTGKITSAYDTYKIFFSDVTPATDNAELWFRTSTDNGGTWDSGASDYSWCASRIAAGNAIAGDSSTGSTRINLTGVAGSNLGLGTATGEYGSGEITILKPDTAKYCNILYEHSYLNSAGVKTMFNGNGTRLTEADVDAVQILMSTGNIASGTFKLYGVKDSENASTTASAATQAEMEAGTSTTTFVSPGRSQYHPSAAKAWIKFTGEGTIAISASYNTTSITDITTGEYTWTIATDFSGADWCFQGAVESEGGAGTFGRTINIQDGEQAAGTVNVITGIAATSTVDVTTVHCAGYGDQ